MEQKTQNQLKASDLRIGNWIDSERGLVQVAELQLWNNRIGVKSPEFENFVWSRCDGIKPIPLTEEWHNKFGVEVNGIQKFSYKIRDDIAICFWGDYVFLVHYYQSIEKPTAEDSFCTIWNKDIKKRDMYVHEWQNLYHALTGEELTYGK